MCLPYTLVYVCDDCIEAGCSKEEASYVVEPDAQDRVVGGYNHEGEFCKMRWLIRPYPAQQRLKPSSCPSLFVYLRQEEDSRVTFTRVGFTDSQRKIRPWVCPDHSHRHKTYFKYSIIPNQHPNPGSAQADIYQGQQFGQVPQEILDDLRRQQENVYALDSMDETK